MKRRAIDLPAALVADIRAMRCPDPEIIGADIGSVSAGLAMISSTRKIAFSMQGTPEEVSSTFRLLMGDRRASMFVMESPYMRVRVDARGEINHGRERTQMNALWQMGRAAGHICCRLRENIAGAVVWEPLPSSARAFLGLNRRATGDATAREETNAGVVLWARATTGLDLRTERGATCYDEANAIVLAYAGLAVIDSVRAMEV